MTVKDYTHKKLDVVSTEGLLAEWNEVHNDKYYDIDTSRERMSKALSKTRTYHLRVPIIDRAAIVRTESTQNIINCKDSGLYPLFPVMKSVIEEIGQKLFGGWTIMGRVFVTRLDPSESIGRHIDEGHYFETLHRFHIPLQTEGSLFLWDDDSVQLKQGDLWMLNNSVPHWVENTSGKWRTHLIFDAC